MENGEFLYVSFRLKRGKDRGSQLLTGTGGGLFLTDDRLPEGGDDEEVGDCQERLGKAVEVVHVGENLVVLQLG